MTHTIRDRILAYLQQHPDGIDDDALAATLQLKSRQQANSRCRQLEQEGLVIRKTANGKIHNFWAQAHPLLIPNTSIDEQTVTPSENGKAGHNHWFWEGNVQTSVVRFLQQQQYMICSTADTARKERGIDIIALHNTKPLWITVKGYPKGTPRTRPTTQAGHWFKQAIFDIIKYRGENAEVELAIALPDFPRYRNLAQVAQWFQQVAGFCYFWVDQSGAVRQSNRTE